MSFKLVKSITSAHSDGIWSINWTAKTNRLLTASVDETIKVWNASEFTPLFTYEGHQ